MASRKQFTPKGPTPTDAHVYAEFMKELLAGTIRPNTLYRRPGQGRLRLEFDERPGPPVPPRPNPRRRRG